LAAFAFIFGLPLAFAAQPVPPRPIENKIPAAAAGVYDPSKVTVVPVVTQQGVPLHPRELLEAGVGGDATILCTVKTDGSVTDAMIVKASDIRFGDAALAAVLAWRFRPAVLKGTPVDCRLMVPIKFKPPTKEGKR